MKYLINTFQLIEHLLDNLVVGPLSIMGLILLPLIAKSIRILMNFENKILSNQKFQIYF